MRDKDFGLRDFLDLFNHRLIAQFYRAWEKCHFFVGYESSRRGATGNTDRFTQMLFSLVGLGTAGLRDVARRSRTNVLLYYAGHFSHRPRSAVALEQIVSDLFRVPTEIQQFRGQWMRLRSSGPDTTSPGTKQPARRVGDCGCTSLGHREQDSAFDSGELSYEKFREFMPGGTGHRVLGQIVRSFVGPAFDFDLQLVLT